MFSTRSAPFKLTLFGRSLLLVSLEFAANIVCWVVAASRSHALLGLAILAWTIGLRHGRNEPLLAFAANLPQRSTQTTSGYSTNRLGPPAIDNATRTLINHGQLAITCGLFFSLGHSTIVIVVNVALVISTSIYDRLSGVGNIGSIIGTAISASFLFIVGLANAIILCKILRQRRRARRRRALGHEAAGPERAQNDKMLVMRWLGPLVNFVNRPWKMYPVGVLFGLGFDTASSIALLAISALAKDRGDDKHIPPPDVILLPLLFTTGMTLVDSLDSILMLYSYTGFADHSWRILEPRGSPLASENDATVIAPSVDRSGDATRTGSKTAENAGHDANSNAVTPEHEDRVALVKRRTMSNLSIVLTIMSILLAFSISLIEIMGLIGANCERCEAAASAPGGGLAGAWWRGWAQANENSGYIGAGIVGAFVVLVCGWYLQDVLRRMFWSVV